MSYAEQAAMFENRLQKNISRIENAAQRLGQSCYRIYDADIPEIPLLVDWYEGYLHVALMARRKFRDMDNEAWLDAMLEVLMTRLDIPAEKVFVKTRRRQKGSWQYSKFAHERSEIVVHEDGLKFKVNLSDYLDTGLFLDHRITRQMVREESEGKSVLNLFAYTGAFTVHAIAGGARKTVTVDMSNTYLRWARENLALNQMSLRGHRFERADILQYLASPDRARERYDLIVLDPPTFSNSKKMDDTLEIQRDHPWLINTSLGLLKPGGALYFSTNFRNFKLQPGQLHGASLEELTHKTIPHDFQHSKPHQSWRITRA
ncbi:class I SAM-dependent methyltransferase [Lujinxingia vulgaris]|nr:class I SAM-dependent methyltransferase [Lujinxingia vulgaris]